MNTAVDVRLGKVTDVNKEKRLVRCKFEDTGITSGWLPVDHGWLTPDLG